MKNTTLISGGWSNGMTIVRILVIPTNREYFLIGKLAESYLKRYVNVEDR